MSTHFINDMSPEALDLVHAIQRFVESAVKRAEAERAVSPSPQKSEKVGVKEAAAILGVAPRTVYAYVEQSRLTPRRTGPKGGKLLFLRADVEKVRDEK